MRPMLCSTMTTVMSSSARMRRTVAMSCSTSACGQTRRRLVEKQQPGLHEQGAAQLDALVQPVRELVRRAGAPPSRGRCARGARAPHRGAHVLGAPGARQPHRPLDRTAGQAGVGAQEHVLEHRLVQPQGRMLERACQPVIRERRGARPAHFGVVDLDRAAARPVVAADAVEQGGLAGAVRADEPEDLARLDGERHVLQHLDAAEAKAHVLQDQLSGHAHLSLRRVLRSGTGRGGGPACSREWDGTDSRADCQRFWRDSRGVFPKRDRDRDSSSSVRSGRRRHGLPLNGSRRERVARRLRSLGTSPQRKGR